MFRQLGLATSNWGCVIELAGRDTVDDSEMCMLELDLLSRSETEWLNNGPVVVLEAHVPSFTIVTVKPALWNERFCGVEVASAEVCGVLGHGDRSHAGNKSPTDHSACMRDLSDSSAMVGQ